MWDSHFHGTPSKVIVEEISSENNSDKTFKVGQIYSHPLYVYKLEISKIEAYKGESYSYRNASIFARPEAVRKSGLPRNAKTVSAPG